MSNFAREVLSPVDLRCGVMSEKMALRRRAHEKELRDKHLPVEQPVEKPVEKEDSYIQDRLRIHEISMGSLLKSLEQLRSEFSDFRQFMVDVRHKLDELDQELEAMCHSDEEDGEDVQVKEL